MFNKLRNLEAIRLAMFLAPETPSTIEEEEEADETYLRPKLVVPSISLGSGGWGAERGGEALKKRTRTNRCVQVARR